MATIGKLKAVNLWLHFNTITLLINLHYYSLKIFPQFLLAKSTRFIHHNQLLMTKFGRILSLARK